MKIPKNMRFKFVFFIIQRLFWLLLFGGAGLYNYFYMGDEIKGLLFFVIMYIYVIERNIEDLSKRIK